MKQFKFHLDFLREAQATLPQTSQQPCLNSTNVVHILKNISLTIQATQPNNGNIMGDSEANYETSIIQNSCSTVQKELLSSSDPELSQNTNLWIND